MEQSNQVNEKDKDSGSALAREVEQAIKDGSVDEEWCLVEYAWWSQWKAWLDEEKMPRPREIENSRLLQSEVCLQTGLIWHEHYEVLPRRAWEALVSEFGGRPMIACSVTRDGRVALETARVCMNGDAMPLLRRGIDKSKISQLSCAQCFAQIELKSALGCGRCGSVAYCDARCQRAHWRIHRGSECDQLRTTALEIDPAYFENEEDCLELSSASSCTSSNSKKRDRETSNGMMSIEDDESLEDHRFRMAERRVVEQREPIVGLDNVGNTCFLNASVQSLRMVRPLSKYFVAESYRDDINTTNPLGCMGKIAHAYATTLQAMLMSDAISLAPSQLLRALVAKNPDLGGRGQQDAHELLETLLDGLHEDTKRPIRPSLQSTPKLESEAYANDGEVAASAWSEHWRRNASTIAASTHGLLRSTLECPVCNLRCARFDPFSTLELEIAEADPQAIDDPSALSEGDDDILPSEEVTEPSRTPRTELHADSSSPIVSPSQASGYPDGIMLQSRRVLLLEGSDCTPRWAPPIIVPAAPRPALLALLSAAEAALPALRGKDLAVYELGIQGNEFSSPRRLFELPVEAVVLTRGDSPATIEKRSVLLVVVAEANPGQRLGLVRHLSPEADNTGNLLEVVTPLSLGADWSEDRIRLSVWRAAKRVVELEGIDARPPNPADFRFLTIGSAVNSFSRRLIKTKQQEARKTYMAMRGEDDSELDDSELDSIADDLLEEELDSPVSAVRTRAPNVGAFVADWAETSRVMSRNIRLKPRRAIPLDLDGAQLARFTQACDLAVIELGRARALDRRTKRRALERAERENTEASRRLWRQPLAGISLFRGGAPITLEACLRRFTSLERLDVDNSWHCTKCNEPRCARKRIALWRTPDVLIFALKRFSPLTGRKLDRPVDFPLDNLDLAPFTAHAHSSTGSHRKSSAAAAAKSGNGSTPSTPTRLVSSNCSTPSPPRPSKNFAQSQSSSSSSAQYQANPAHTYTLFAVVNHFGHAGYGHYTAYVRDVWQPPSHPRYNQWFKADDSSVTPVDASVVCSSAAYVLFYSRDSTRCGTDSTDDFHACPPVAPISMSGVVSNSVDGSGLECVADPTATEEEDDGIPSQSLSPSSASVLNADDENSSTVSPPRPPCLDGIE